MIYIVVLNWNSEQDTIKCVKSLLLLNSIHDFKIIICDNDSKKESSKAIENYLNIECTYQFISLDEQKSHSFIITDEKIIFVQNNKNYGYAGGNNIGLKLALSQSNMQYCWVLNNDTEVHTSALDELVNKMSNDDRIGICGSRLVEMENKNKVQALGGVINPWFCITTELGTELTVNSKINEQEWEKKIDFVVGASLFFSRDCLKSVGLLCEDYFLYFEEIDYCNRLKQKGFKIGISSNSIVYHEQGASTSKSGYSITEFYSIRNRILIAKKFYKKYLFFVRLRIFLLVIKRMVKFDFISVKKYIFFLIL